EWLQGQGVRHEEQRRRVRKGRRQGHRAPGRTQELRALADECTGSALPPHTERFRARRNGAALAMRVAAVAALVALLPGAVPAGPASAPQQAGRIVELAGAGFGSLSTAELAVLRGAPRRELVWVGPDSNPDNPANDAAHGDQWGGERSVRGSLLRWLHTDP